jgi:hypothetical protein
VLLTTLRQPVMTESNRNPALLPTTTILPRPLHLFISASLLKLCDPLFYQTLYNHSTLAWLLPDAQQRHFTFMAQIYTRVTTPFFHSFRFNRVICLASHYECTALVKWSVCVYNNRFIPVLSRFPYLPAAEQFIQRSFLYSSSTGFRTISLPSKPTRIGANERSKAHVRSTKKKPARTIGIEAPSDRTRERGRSSRPIVAEDRLLPGKSKR